MQHLFVLETSPITTILHFPLQAHSPMPRLHPMFQANGTWKKLSLDLSESSEIV